MLAFGPAAADSGSVTHVVLVWFIKPVDAGYVDGRCISKVEYLLLWGQVAT